MSHDLLVVDDELEICGELSVYFNRKGYRVLATSDATEAIKLYRQEKPVVVVTDYSMPEINGIDLLKKIKAINRMAQVIFVSGKASIRVAVEALKADAFDFLEKPVDLVLLERKVKEAMERVRSAAAEPVRRGIAMEHETTAGISRRISILTLHVDLDDFQSARLNEAFRDILRQNVLEKDIVLSLQNVKYINNVGLNFLVEMVNRLKERNFRVVLTDLGSSLDQYLRTLGYHTYFWIESGLKAAVEALDQDRL